MAESQDRLADYIERMPPPGEIRHRLCENLREARLLRQLLRLSEQRQKTKEAATR